MAVGETSLGGPAAEVLIRWVDALGASAGVRRVEVEARLAPSAQRLWVALNGPNPPSPAYGRAIGAALVAAGYRDPVTIARTMEFVSNDAAVKAGAALDIVVSLTAGMATGFAAALRETALTEQESVLAAALAAVRSAEGRRQLGEARFDAVFEGTSVGIATIDRTGLVTNVNAALAAMFGDRPANMRGRLVADVVGPDNMRAAFTDFQRLLAGEISHFRTDTDFLRPDGGVTSLDLSMSNVRDTAGEIDFLIAITVDVTARNQLARSLWHEAHHDSLTGLPNRALFFQRLRAAKYPLGLCYLDLDGFKRVNDVGGHAAGDEVLRVVADRLLQALSRVTRLRKPAIPSRGHPHTDTASHWPGVEAGPVARGEAMVARLGGDEFVVLLENCSATDIAELAAELNARVASPAGWLAVPVSASIGVVHAAIRGAEDKLLLAADDAMYQAKSAGGHQWCNAWTALAGPVEPC